MQMTFPLCSSGIVTSEREAPGLRLCPILAGEAVARLEVGGAEVVVPDAVVADGVDVEAGVVVVLEVELVGVLGVVVIAFHDR